MCETLLAGGYRLCGAIIDRPLPSGALATDSWERGIQLGLAIRLGQGRRLEGMIFWIAIGVWAGVNRPRWASAGALALMGEASETINHQQSTLE